MRRPVVIAFVLTAALASLAPSGAAHATGPCNPDIQTCY